MYKSKYYTDLSYFLHHGWTLDEVNTYFPILENLSNKELCKLHDLCNIQAFSKDELLDKEEAIHMLVSPSDTPKTVLIHGIETLRLKPHQKPLHKTVI